ncbi:MAG: hypothetical protein HOG99_13790 [Gemmatimonadetes bacterium]|nr:hypothetical protein [Gemmatimonadota bacterium]
MTTHNWTQKLLPLPQEFAAEGSRHVAANRIRVTIVGDAPQLQQAGQILRQAIGASGTDRVELTIEVGTYADQSEQHPLQDLSHLANAEQAYQITTVSDDRIVISGQGPVGGVYGAMTMAQLLTAPAGRRIHIPLLQVVDWPDINQRGLWNFPEGDEWIDWLAPLKLNYGKMADTRLTPVRRGRRNTATVEVERMQKARRLGFEYIPYVLHLNFLHGVDLFRAYPELAGKGDGALAGRYFAHKQGNQHRAPCASEPRLVTVLSEWLQSIASQGADEVSCWLSERPCQCECERCTPVGQFVLETRAFVAAWENVRSTYPDLLIRIFSSTTTPEQDDQILAELPAAVRFERACASGMERVRHQPRDLFANPLLDVAASEGRWIASYDVPIGAYGNVDTPETKVPQYSAQRIRDYVQQLHRRNYAGAYGMLAWGLMAREVCGFSIAALAEYSWNGDGRSIEDFATAWATQEGLKSPEKIGQWAKLLGEVEFDVYDDGFPTHYTMGIAAQMVEAGDAPRFTEGIFRHFHRREDFDTRLAVCHQAQALLDSKAHRQLILATQVVASYVQLASALWDIAHLHAHGELGKPKCQQQLAATSSKLAKAGQTNTDAIVAWRRHLGDEPWAHRVHDAIGATQTTVALILSHISDQHSDLI